MLVPRTLVLLLGLAWGALAQMGPPPPRWPVAPWMGGGPEGPGAPGGPGGPPFGPPQRPPPRGGEPPERLALERPREFYADLVDLLRVQVGQLEAYSAAVTAEAATPPELVRYLAALLGVRREQHRWIRELAGLKERAAGRSDFMEGLGRLGPVPWHALEPLLRDGAAGLRRQWDHEVAPRVGRLPRRAGPDPHPPAPAADAGWTQVLAGLTCGAALGLILLGRRRARARLTFPAFVEGLARVVYADLHTLKNRAAVAPGDPGLGPARQAAGGQLAGLSPPRSLVDLEPELARLAGLVADPAGGAEQAHQLGLALLRRFEVPVFETLDRLVGRFRRDRALELVPGLPGPPTYAEDRASAERDLELVVGNLIENAFQAGARAVTLRLDSCEPTARATRVQVVDDGPGFAPADRERALKAAIPGQGEGRGTGLLTVARTCRSRGWEIVLEAGAPTTFTLTIPALAQGESDRPSGSGPSTS